MSFQDFWENVRYALRTTGLEIPEAPRLDAPAIESVLRESEGWLTLDTVHGFDEADFSFLPDDGRRRLRELVEAFRACASTRTFRNPPPAETVEAARPILRDLIQILEFDRYENAESFRLGKLIEQAIQFERPPELVDLRFSEGPDHSGGPALSIWAYLSDDVSGTDESFLKAARELRPWLASIVRRVAPDHWPYLYFRPASQEAETVDAT